MTNKYDPNPGPLEVQRNAVDRHARLPLDEVLRGDCVEISHSATASLSATPELTDDEVAVLCDVERDQIGQTATAAAFS
jgi:hypothetical protein